MRRLLWIPICFVALLVPAAVLASGGEGDFNGVIRSIESTYGVRATRIPFLGLISLISRSATHGGVGGMHIAEFEGFHAQVDCEELNNMVEKKLGRGWERVIRETSRKGKEQTLILMHPEGNRMGLFILDLDGHELDVVQVSVNPDHLNEKLNRYGHHHEHYGTDHEEDGD
jgi:hypothetical protein